MSLDGMDVILNLATSRNLVFQGISEFKNPSHDSEWNGRDLQTDNFSKLNIITFSKQFQVKGHFRTLVTGRNGKGDLQTGNFR